MAVITIVHVLLNKSDPKSVIIWTILLLWLPLPGLGLYLVFGLNRAGRDDHVRLPQMTHATKLDLIVGVEPIHDALLTSIRDAQSRITLTTYIFRNDALGQEVKTALMTAAERGIQVRLLYDGFGTLRWRLGRPLSSNPNFQRRIWSQSSGLRSVFRLNARYHRKLCIIDDTTAFVGSANIGHVDNLETQLRITGPAAAALGRTAERDWAYASNQIVSVFEPSPTRHGNMRIVASSPRQPVEHLRLVLLDVVLSAKRSIRIVTPYFVPDQGLVSALLAARYKGVDVTILLSKRSNFRSVDWASLAQCESLIRAGCRIFHRPDVFDHSKLMSVDGHWSLIGSSNWDARSLRLNDELDLAVCDTAFTAALNAEIDRRLACAGPPAEPGRSTGRRAMRNALAKLGLPYL